MEHENKHQTSSKNCWDMTADVTVLTPNRRLSATLRQHYNQSQIQSNHTIWETPAILPLSSWLQQLWKDYATQVFTPLPLLLTTSQELFLWEKIIANANNSNVLLQVAETAHTAKSAWTLLKQWQISIHHPLFHTSEDFTAFYHWAEQFQQLCLDENWLDTASLPELLMAKIQAKEIRPAQKLMLYGFTEYSPQLLQLLKTCENAGSVIQPNCYPTPKNEMLSAYHRITLTDHEDEIETMARWAKALAHNQPRATIACVLPTLDKTRNRVVQIFTDVFSDDQASTSFNVSAGKSLAKYPIVYAALQLLSLYKQTISFATFHFLLTTPFMGEAEKERIRRAKYDVTTRMHNLHNINLPAILEEEDACPYLAKRLKIFFTQLAELPQTLSYTAWTEQWSTLLTTLGWPGERSLDSEEHQVVENWLNLLSEFQSLDYVSGPISFQQALQALQKMAKNRVFQPQSPQARVQVLGLLEAAGMPCDYLWVAGMDDVSWPPPPRPNPFIPKQIQRSLHMPHATAERELMFCKMLTEQFKQHAHFVVFSHAEKYEELELQPSPLIRNLSSLKKQDLPLADYLPYATQIYQSKKIEWIQDEWAPPVKTNEKIRGGARILTQQSLCAFKAFAECRLHAHELETPLPGLCTRDRGILIHKILEIIWLTIQDHAHLLSLPEAELHALIQTSIENSLAFASFSHNENTVYLALEKQRLHRVILEWLTVEKQRPPFRVIQNEKNTALTIGPLALQLRIDRMDELSDGQLLIIDYKTGKHNEINHWFSARPEEPQLPLYALLGPDTICGITFAQIYPGAHGFKGISQYTLDMKGIKIISEVKQSTALTWKDQLLQWRSTLTQLSEDFYHGIAKVNPKDPVQTCTRCTLSSLCRIKEACS